MKRSLLVLPFALTTFALFSAGSSGCVMKQTAGTRDTGQSHLMDETFAGKNACNPEDHDRPFIIEWDATDMSSFEQLAGNQAVVVKYEGCTLKVLDECTNDAWKSQQTAYNTPDWTSGSLEKIEISNSGELYAKLPLGQAEIGGRVAGGEKFRMEYFVAGTVTATDSSVYLQQLKDGEGNWNWGCEGATHFVYAYNLGAFALGSVNETSAEVGGSIYGFGAGGSRDTKYAADKQGGDLAACKEDSATEVAGCKAPIRLTLRKLRPGEPPEDAAMNAADTPEGIAAAAMVNAKVEMSEEAGARYEAAARKMNAGDGKGCLKDLDAHDKLDPKHKSTDPKSGFAMLRAQCVMKAGQCKAGKVQLRKAYEATMSSNFGPEQIDRAVESLAAMNCTGGMSDRDTLLQSLLVLQQGGYQTKKTVKECQTHYARAKKLIPKVKPKDDEDHQIIQAKEGGMLWTTVPACFARAGACDKAFKAWVAETPAKSKEWVNGMDDAAKKKQFASMQKKCADWAGDAR